MSALRQKSLSLTGYLESLLDNPSDWNGKSDLIPYKIISPRDPMQRGAQLSVRLSPGLLQRVLSLLEDEGVVVDERKPDVIRIAPTPLYNTFAEVWQFARIFISACCHASEAKTREGSQPVMMQGQVENAWAAIV